MPKINPAILAAREQNNKMRAEQFQEANKITVEHTQTHEDIEFQIISKSAGYKLQTKNFAGEWRDETKWVTLGEANEKMRNLIAGESPLRKTKRAAAKISWERNHKK